MGMVVKCHTLATLPQGNIIGAHCTEGWVGTRASVESCGKSHHPAPGFNPWTVKPVGILCTVLSQPTFIICTYVLIKIFLFNNCFLVAGYVQSV